jgi:bifunctional non-homologous end joining protein LigD
VTGGDDSLREYRAKRSFSETPEPDGSQAGAAGATGTARFVIQEHHARRLHWDLRLEREGVLASWALPRGVPADPQENRLAVRTEDHPLGYIDFHGEIPEGQYGAGTMTIWDRGTYETEKWEDRKVIVRLHGEKVSGLYSLFATRGKDWMIHRMDPPPEGWEPMPDLVPMLPTPGGLPDDEQEWAFEIRWNGLRALAYCEPGHLELRALGGDISGRFPEVRLLLESLEGRPALIDGALVAFSPEAPPDRERIERRAAAASDSAIRRLRRSDPATFVAFDLLHLDGRSLIPLSYAERREALDRLELEGDSFQVPRYHQGEGGLLMEAARAQGLAGVVAKRLAAPYQPGVHSDDWIEIAV